MRGGGRDAGLDRTSPLEYFRKIAAHVAYVSEIVM